MWKTIVKVDLFVVASDCKLWDMLLYENKLIYILASNKNNKNTDLCNNIGYSENNTLSEKLTLGSYNTTWLYLYHILEEKKLIHGWKKTKGAIFDFQGNRNVYWLKEVETIPSLETLYLQGMIFTDIFAQFIILL